MDVNEYNKKIEELKKRVASGERNLAKQLGDMLRSGPTGEGDNISEALPYWYIAAKNGDKSIDGRTYATLGVALLKGYGGMQINTEDGIACLMVAAGQGDAYAQYMLGEAYREGTGVEEDHEQAVYYYKQAALQNDSESQFCLGLLCYEYGHPSWLHWLTCAHLRGKKLATKFLDELIKESSNPAATKKSIMDEMEQIKKYGVRCNTFEEVPLKAAKKSEGCYIATAVYGSYDAPEVRILRRYRDERLKNSYLGRTFIKVYYAISPPLAQKLKDLKKVNGLVRKILDKFVENIKNRI